MLETNKRRATDREPKYDHSVQVVGYAFGAAATIGAVIAIAVAL
jgi:hypothetical protein